MSSWHATEDEGLEMSVVDDNAEFEAEDKAVLEDLGIPEQDPEAAPEQLQVTLEELVEANYQSIKVVFAAALAQIMGGDPLTAQKLFRQLEQDVEEHRMKFLLMADGYRKAVDEVTAEVVDEEE